MGIVSMASALSNGQYVPFTGTPGVKVVGSHSLETPAEATRLRLPGHLSISATSRFFSDGKP